MIGKDRWTKQISLSDLKFSFSTNTTHHNTTPNPCTPHGVIPDGYFRRHTFDCYRSFAREHGQTPEINSNLQTKLCIYTYVPLTGSYLPASFEVIPLIAIWVLPAIAPTGLVTNEFLRSNQTYKPNYAITSSCLRSLLRSQPDLNSLGFNTFSIINSHKQTTQLSHNSDPQTYRQQIKLS